MNRKELEQKLRGMGIRPDAYSVDGGHPSEAYVLTYDGRRWRVYYGERGHESGAVAFDDEPAACSHMLALLESDHTTRK